MPRDSMPSRSCCWMLDWRTWAELRAWMRAERSWLIYRSPVPSYPCSGAELVSIPSVELPWALSVELDRDSPIISSSSSSISTSSSSSSSSEGSPPLSSRLSLTLLLLSSCSCWLARTCARSPGYYYSKSK